MSCVSVTWMDLVWDSTRVSAPQVVTFLFCLHGPGLKAIQANPGQQFSTRADTNNMLEYCPGHANPCLHEEISTIFTPSQSTRARVKGPLAVSDPAVFNSV